MVPFIMANLGSHVSSFVVVADAFGAFPLLFAYAAPLFGVVEPAAVLPVATAIAADDEDPPAVLPLDPRLGGTFDTTVDPYTRIASSFSSSNASWMEKRGCFIFRFCFLFFWYVFSSI